jgi:hypothetical protein
MRFPAATTTILVASEGYTPHDVKRGPSSPASALAICLAATAIGSFFYMANKLTSQLDEQAHREASFKSFRQPGNEALIIHGGKGVEAYMYPGGAQNPAVLDIGEGQTLVVRKALHSMQSKWVAVAEPGTTRDALKSPADRALSTMYINVPLLSRDKGRVEKLTLNDPLLPNGYVQDHYAVTDVAVSHIVPTAELSTVTSMLSGARLK